MLSFFIGLHPTGCFFSFSLGYIQQVVFSLSLGYTQLLSFFVGLHPTVLFCYFWLDPKVTKRSRLNRPGYSGQRLRCRLRNSLRSNSAGSGRYAFTLRFTPVRLGLSQKAPLSLMIADTACFSFLFPFFSLFLLHPPFCFFISPCCFLCIPFLFPCISLLHPHPVGAGLCSALPQNHQHHSALPHKIINLTHLFVYNIINTTSSFVFYILYLCISLFISLYLPFASPRRNMPKLSCPRA